MNPYYEYLKAQRGNGFVANIGEIYEGVNHQSGFGYDHLYELQHGGGIFSGLSSLLRLAMPYLSRGMRTLGSTAVSTVADIAKDAIAGTNMKTAATNRLKEARSDLVEAMPNVIEGLSTQIANKIRKSGRRKRSISSNFKGEGSNKQRRKQVANKLSINYPILNKL